MKCLQIFNESARIDWHAGIYKDGRTKLVIALMHVRAANDIEIEYDSDRDGWVIYMTVTLGSRHNQAEGCYEPIEERREKAFIPAWDKDEVSA